MIRRCISSEKRKHDLKKKKRKISKAEMVFCKIMGIVCSQVVSMAELL